MYVLKLCKNNANNVYFENINVKWWIVSSVPSLKDGLSSNLRYYCFYRKIQPKVKVTGDVLSYRTRVPFCCFGMTRNVKRGPESTIWMVDPSGRSTYLLMWMCWLAVPFVVSAPFDDKICWYGQAFRINILCNRPILLMDEQLMLGLQNQHSVQLTHFVDGTDNDAEWKF